MILHVYTVYDSDALAFLPPFFMRSKGEAIRSFTDTVNEQGHQFNKHMHAYSLFWLADYEDQTGMITPLKAPERIVTAIEVAGDDLVFPPDRKVG